MANRDLYSSYYPPGRSRGSPPPDSGMYSRDPPPRTSFGRSSPQMSQSLDDLRSEFNKIDGDLKLEDFTWEKMGDRVQDLLEKRAAEPVVGSDGNTFFPAPKRKNRDRRDMPLIINGNIVPRKDALLIDLVLNNKATLEAQLALCKQPIVGLEFVVEYVDPDGQSPRVYFCNMCKQFNTVQSVMEHITGYNHRVRYIALKYPNQARTYLLPDGRRANRNFALIRMAQGRCQELELVYGRGDYEVRNERPTIPKDTELDVENDLINIEEGRQTEVLRKALTLIKQCKLACDEDIKISKQIINDLTDAIIEYKSAATDEKMNASINSLLTQGRSGNERF